MEKKICLSIEQMRELKELGVETKDASMCWVRDPEGHYYLTVHDESCYEMSFMNPVPAFALQDMFELMPNDIYNESIYNTIKRYFLKMDKFNNKYKFSYWNPYVDPLATSAYQENAIDAAFELFCWLAGQRLLKGGEK